MFKNTLRIIENTKIWFSLSAVIIAIGLISMILHGGLNQGIDFKGGTIVDIKIGKAYSIEDVRKIAVVYDKEMQVQAVEGDIVSMRSGTLTDAQLQSLTSDISKKYSLSSDAVLQSQRIGPSISKELTQSSFLAAVVSMIAILIFVTLRFEFRSGVSAIAALAHDLLITLSVYAVLQIPIGSSFIAAILTILGYSMSDTIVVFDRIRENRKLGKIKEFGELANVSITQTLTRSINTILTVLITITSLYIFGVQAVRDFALPLIIGVASGCYSSIFIASPIWVIWMNSDKKKKIA